MTEPKGRKITELEVFEAMLQRAEITYRKIMQPPDEELELPSYVICLLTSWRIVPKTLANA